MNCFHLNVCCNICFISKYWSTRNHHYTRMGQHGILIENPFFVPLYDYTVCGIVACNMQSYNLFMNLYLKCDKITLLSTVHSLVICNPPKRISMLDNLWDNLLLTTKFDHFLEIPENLSLHVYYTLNKKNVFLIIPKWMVFPSICIGMTQFIFLES